MFYFKTIIFIKLVIYNELNIVKDIWVFVEQKCMTYDNGN